LTWELFWHSEKWSPHQWGVFWKDVELLGNVVCVLALAGWYHLTQNE
jgi:hypothetical protein